MQNAEIKMAESPREWQRQGRGPWRWGRTMLPEAIAKLHPFDFAQGRL
jgi:hypothetical protein